jgi:hypothetical protein
MTRRVRIWHLARHNPRRARPRYPRTVGVANTASPYATWELNEVHVEKR